MQIILDPANAITDPELDVDGLHPLVKALVLLHRDPEKLQPNIVDAALKTCWFIAESTISISKDDFGEITEYVRHSIGPCEFLSEGYMAFCSGESLTEELDSWGFLPSARSRVHATRLDWVPSKFIPKENFTTTGSLIRLWDHDRCHTRHLSPHCCVTDSGLFIGTISCRLVAVGGLPVNGPSVNLSQYGGDDCDDITEDYYQPGQDSRDPEYFCCWAHYLSEEQARQLNIPSPPPGATPPQEIDGLPLYPAWIDPEWARKHAWIRMEDLEESYQSGKVERPGTLTFAVAPQSWRPGKKRSLVLGAWNVSMDESTPLAHDLQRLFANLGKLVQACPPSQQDD